MRLHHHGIRLRFCGSEIFLILFKCFNLSKIPSASTSNRTTRLYSILAQNSRETLTSRTFSSLRMEPALPLICWIKSHENETEWNGRPGAGMDRGGEGWTKGEGKEEGRDNRLGERTTMAKQASREEKQANN